MAKPRNHVAARQSLSARAYGILARLFTWYIIITGLFRCPRSAQELKATSPMVCKVHFKAEEYVAPYVRPYYDAYAAPYVDVVRPYAEAAHANVYAPASALAMDTYDRYAAPRVTQALEYSGAQWQRTIVPLAESWRARIGGHYHTYLGHHVDRVYSTLSPFTDKIWHIAQTQYETVLLPSYQKSLPYAQSMYRRGCDFVVEIGLPYTRFAFDTTTTFLRRRIWPPIRVLYGQNVEPQLSKIKQRLGSYRDSKSLEMAVESMDGPLSSSVLSPSLPNAVSSTPITDSDITAVSSRIAEASSSASSLASSPVQNQAENMTEELKRWQAKFARASDKGAEDLAERIGEITSSQISHSAEGYGAALVTELEESSHSALSALRAEILNAVSKLPEESTDVHHAEAYETVRAAIRSAGNVIKNKAQELRMWKLKYKSDLDSLLQAASESTLDVIDGIRDLGLQEIGMRWASMDHATYQDWAEYHKLKKTMDDWRVKVSDVASKHPGVAAAKSAAEQIEDQGMGIAQDAAEELARLKDVARWKIDAKDDTENFDTRQLPAAAARLGQKVMEKVNSVGEAVMGTTSSQGMAESIISAATESAASAVSIASQAVIDPVHDAAASILESISDSAINLATSLSASASSVIEPVVQSASSDATALLSSGSSYVKPVVSSAIDTDAEATELSSSSLLSAMSVAASLAPAADDDVSIASSLSSAASSLAASGASLPSSLSSSLTSNIESIISAADRAAGPKARSIISSIEEVRSSASSVVSASSSEGWIASVASRATSEGSSFTNRVVSTASSAATVGSSIGAGAMDDIIDSAALASESIKSMVEEAGSAYETATRSLTEASDQ